MAIPPGFERCPDCGEFNGTTEAKYLNWDEGHPALAPEPTASITVTCLCKGVPCRKCGKNLVHRSGTNEYTEATNTIGHWPWFASMIPCRQCAIMDAAT